MYDLFSNELITSHPIQTIPQFIYIKTGLNRELNKVIQFYRKNIVRVPNQHPLVRFILSLPISMKRDIFGIADRGEALMFNQASLLNFTNSLSYGRVYSPGFIYGKNTHEIIITHNESFDVQDAYDNWEDLQPIRILRHPFTDLSMGLLDGKYKSYEKGIAVILLNVPMLCVMLKGWYDTYRSDDVDRNMLGLPTMSVHQFVHTYPLLNALKSHIDIALFNRLSNTYLVDEVADFKNPHPFQLNDYSEKVDDYIRKQLQLLKNYPFLFDQLLVSLPSIFNDNLREVIQIPAMAPTRQVKWALLVARIPIIKFLLQYNSLEEVKRNEQYIRKVAIALKNAKSDKTLDRNLPRDVAIDIDNSLHRDIEPYTA